MCCVVQRLCLLSISLQLIIGRTLARSAPVHYTDEFVLHVKEGESAAQRLAEQYHLELERRVKMFDDRISLKE